MAAQIIQRNEFGALTQYHDTAQKSAKSLLQVAIKAGKLDAQYNRMEWDKRHGYIGWCLNYDIYDVTVAAVLVQRRETERTKYGTSPHKDYYIIRRCGRGVRVTEAPKARVVKLAKLASELGEVIDTLEGRTQTPLKQVGPFSKKELAYKIVEQRDGRFFSVYDEDFEWVLGKAKTEAATDSHDGGYYVFPSIDAAKIALENNVVFASSWQAGKHLVLMECEVAGRCFNHEHSKWCVTFCRPKKVLETLVALPAAA